MSLGDALRLLETLTPMLPPECVVLADALGRVLIQPFFAPFDLPTFSRAAMDGYALRAEDVADATPTRPQTLKVVGEVLAGGVSEPLEPGTARRIATGGAMPEGADAVLRQEDAVVRREEAVLRQEDAVWPSELVAKRPIKPGKDVVKAGVNAYRGELLLPAGLQLEANDLALMAGFGVEAAEVIGQPRVAYVETGDELTSPGQELPPGHIFRSNSLMLSLRARQHGAHVVAKRQIMDDPVQMAAAFDDLLNTADLVVSTGGVSVGPKDLVPGVLEKIGCQQLFRGLPIRPGHPVMAARRGDKLWLGLPGNPTAALITHEVLVRPVLWRMAGLRFSQGFNPTYRATVEGPPLRRGRKTNFFLGRLHAAQDGDTVHVDRGRRPSALPAPFEFNVIARLDPAPVSTAESETSRADVHPGTDLETSQIPVYPVDRNVAAVHLTRFPWDVGAILLAGGQSRRMGHSKLFLPLGGIPMVVRAYQALAAVSAEVRVIGAPTDVIDLLAEWEGEIVRTTCFPDDHPGKGPLGGLITGLRHTPEPVALCLAADLPFVDVPALRHLLDTARAQIRSLRDDRSDESLPARGFMLSDGSERQPLAALYPVERSLTVAQQLWQEGARALQQFVSNLGIQEVPADRPLANVNRPDEYRAARAAFDATQIPGAARTAHSVSGSTEATGPLSPTAFSGAPAVTGAPPILAFSGHSGSGKTTLISRLIPLLKERGLRVVVIKHGGKFELDRPGKDSWCYKQAGADGVLLFSADELAYMARPASPPSFAELVHKVEQDADVIIVEGFKAHPIPKVVVMRDDESWSQHPLAEDPHVQAVYGGLATENATAPTFSRTPKGKRDPVLTWLLDWIVRRLARKRA